MKKKKIEKEKVAIPKCPYPFTIEDIWKKAYLKGYTDALENWILSHK